MKKFLVSSLLLASFIAVNAFSQTPITKAGMKPVAKTEMNVKSKSAVEPATEKAEKAEKMLKKVKKVKKAKKVEAPATK